MCIRDSSNSYNVWWDKKVAVAAPPALIKFMQFMGTFQKFPPRQRPSSFTVDEKTVEKLLNFKSK